MKKILGFLAVLLMACPLWAQSQQRSAILYYNYDLTSASFIYCKYTGKSGDPWQVGGWIPSPANVKTAGSSATITAATAGTNPFAEVAVGDLLSFRFPTTTYMRIVTARASADSITVDSVVDLGTGGIPFEFLEQKCGTGTEDGWLAVDLFQGLTFARNIATFNATSIDSQIECRHTPIPSLAYIIDTKNATGAGAYAKDLSTGAWDSCRLGLKINTDTGAQSITATIGINYKPK